MTRELRRSKYVTDPSEERLGEDIEALLRDQREGSRLGKEALERVAERLDLLSKETITEEIKVGFMRFGKLHLWCLGRRVRMQAVILVCVCRPWRK